MPFIKNKTNEMLKELKLYGILESLVDYQNSKPAKELSHQDWHFHGLGTGSIAALRQTHEHSGVGNRKPVIATSPDKPQPGNRL